MNEQRRQEKREEAIELLRMEWRRVRTKTVGPPAIVNVLAEYEDVLSSSIIESFARYDEDNDDERKQILGSIGKSLSDQFEVDYGNAPSMSDERQSLLHDWIDAWHDLALLNVELDKNAHVANSREKWKNRWGSYASPAIRYPDDGEITKPEDIWWDADSVTGDNGRSRRAARSQPVARVPGDYESRRDEARARMQKARQLLDTK
jgi:hypothetical protein